MAIIPEAAVPALAAITGLVTAVSERGDRLFKAPVFQRPV
jgi:hypothetical protein